MNLTNRLGFESSILDERAAQASKIFDPSEIIQTNTTPTDNKFL